MGALTDRSEEKKQAILHAAADLFVERGYHGVSIDAIVKEVGGSKTNIYNYFGNKEGLFRAIVEDVSQQILSPMARPDINNEPLREALTGLGRRLLSIVLSEKVVAFHRMVVAQAQQFPELGRLFYEAGPQASHRCLVRYLDRQQQLGTLKPSDSQQASTQFIGLLFGLTDKQRLLGVIPELSETEIDAMVDRAVEIFLQSYAIED